MKIEDGGGKNGDMTVSSTQRGNVSAKTRDRMFYASRDDGLAYTGVFDPVTAAAGDYVAYLKNTSSTRNMFITDISFGGVENILWRIWAVTGTAASGETVTPTPMNLSTCLAGTPLPAGMPSELEFELVTNGKVPWSKSSSEPWAPSKRMDLPSAIDLCRNSVVSVIKGNSLSA